MDIESMQVDNAETAGVRTWLADVHTAAGELESCQAIESKIQYESESKSPSPCTPLRRRQLVCRYEEVSPTDTTFSCDSIFDSPPVSPTSPVSALPCDYEEEYAKSESSSECDGEGEIISAKEETINLLSPPTANFSASRPVSLNSYDPPSEAEYTDHAEHTHDSQNDTLAAEVVLPNDIPQLTFLTSCLQCTLANLPCCRTSPNCKRCQRNGQGSLCLLQRRRTRSEMVNGKGHYNTTPVLLRLHGSDDALFERKVALAEEVSHYSA
jgi:hypothetical protein